LKAFSIVAVAKKAQHVAKTSFTFPLSSPLSFLPAEWGTHTENTANKVCLFRFPIEKHKRKKTARLISRKLLILLPAKSKPAESLLERETKQDESLSDYQTLLIF
jgi:hypothetical protein